MLRTLRRQLHPALLALLGAVLLATTSCSSSPGDAETPPLASPSPSSAGVPETDRDQGIARESALRVLRRWDERRSAAFAAGDAAAVSALYLPGSPLARHDVAVLRDFARQGARVVALTPHVVSARVRTASPRVVDLVVVERTVTRVAVGGHERTLAGSGFERHRLRFVQVLGRWRLSSVHEG